MAGNRDATELYLAEKESGLTRGEVERLRAALAESEKRVEAMRGAAKRAMNAVAWEVDENAENPKLFCRGCGRFRDESHEDTCPVAALRAALGATPPRSGPLTNRDVGDESDARAKGRQ